MGLRKGVKGQTGFQIALQALDCRWINLVVFLHEGSYDLIGFLTVILIKNGFEFRFEVCLLGLGHVVQYIFQLVLNTTLPFAVWELVLDGIQHRLVAIGDPYIYRLHTPAFQVVL